MVQTMTGNKDLSFPGNFPPQLELISFIVVSVFSSNYFGNTAWMFIEIFHICSLVVATALRMRMKDEASYASRNISSLLFSIARGIIVPIFHLLCRRIIGPHSPFFTLSLLQGWRPEHFMFFLFFLKGLAFFISISIFRYVVTKEQLSLASLVSSTFSSSSSLYIWARMSLGCWHEKKWIVFCQKTKTNPFGRQSACTAATEVEAQGQVGSSYNFPPSWAAGSVHLFIEMFRPFFVWSD